MSLLKEIDIESHNSVKLAHHSKMGAVFAKRNSIQLTPRRSVCAYSANYEQGEEDGATDGNNDDEN